MSVPEAVGTSTGVKGTVKYPGWGTFFRHVLWHFRGATLAALFCVYVACGPYGIPAILKWARANEGVQHFLRANPVMLWLQQTFFEGQDTQGKSLEDAMVFVALTFTVHAVLYYGMNSFFLFCDATGFLKQYKLPRTPRMKLPRGLLRKTLTESFISQFFTGPITLFLVYRYVASFKSMFGTPAAPDLLTTIGHMALASLFNETLFYFAHRAFHEVPGMYVRFHKQHHRYVGSIGFAAEYAHPLEQVLANQGPTAFYCIAFSAYLDQSIWFVWLAWRLWETFEAHSGYSFEGSLPAKLGFTFSERAAFHDWHHSDNRGCYGVFWLDYLFGTMDSFAQLMEKGGHRGKKTDQIAVAPQQKTD